MPLLPESLDLSRPFLTISLPLTAVMTVAPFGVRKRRVPNLVPSGSNNGAKAAVTGPPRQSRALPTAGDTEKRLKRSATQSVPVEPQL
jgi:hypothetical protein